MLHSVHTYLLVLVTVLSCLSAPQAQTILPGDDLKNIALGVPYTWVPQPGYRLCTDPGDSAQLTDGIYTEGYFWTQQGTVGWVNHRNIIVTLDLGSDSAIRGVSLRTAAGTAGVTWPSGIRVFVAGEDRQFREVADLLALSAIHGMPNPQSYRVHRYWTDALKTHGRYVAVVVSNQSYTFMDEIEVYAGDPAWLSMPVPGPAIDDMENYLKQRQTWDGIARRLRQDSAAVRTQAMAREVPEKVRVAVLAELEAVAQAAQAEAEKDYSDFRAVLPLNTLHQRIFASQAALWRAAGHKDFLVWQSDLWAPLDHLETPPRDTQAQIAVTMMDNEYRAASLNLTNARDEIRTLRLDIKGLPGGNNPDYITVHEVVWTDTASGVPVAAALPVADRTNNDSWVIHVPVGMTRQVWFTFHPKGVESGEHEGRIMLTEGDTVTEVPLSLHLYPFHFPDKPTLSFGGWDYTDGNGNRGINPKNRDAVIKHLVTHYVDTPWATGAVMPRGTHDAQGHMTTPPDTTRFDEWIARWPDATTYCIFPSVGNSFGSWAMDSPEFNTAVGEWAQFWANHAQSRGIAPKRLAILLLDEPHETAQDRIIIAWARAIEAAGADLTIWEDPTYNGVNDSQEALADVCDVLCPNRPLFLRANEAYRDFYRTQRDRGKQLEFYSCSGPTTLLDPYAYFRLQAWTCWKEGATASYFWAFGDNAGGSSWNEYVLPRNIYTLSFLDDTSIVPAKAMEAAREGIEDYEYFVMLKKAVEGASPGPVRNAAAGLLKTLPDAVLKAGTSPQLMWHTELDRTLADEARLKILETLTALKQR